MRIGVILLLVVILAALLYLFTQGPAKMADGQPDYGQLSQKYFDLLFAPLEGTSSNPIHDLAAFAGTCRQRAARNGPDAEVARLCFRLCARLMTVSRIRETLATELRQYETAPPAVMKITSSLPGETGRGADAAAEQKRRQQFLIDQMLRQKWQPAVQEHRPGCEELLRQIRQIQARRRTLWNVLQEWLAPLARAVDKAQDWLFGDSSARTPPAPSGGTILCGHCQGTGVVTCPECGGFGKVDSGEKETCPQCGGTGRYRKRMTAGTVPCAFCGGTGHAAGSKRVLCATCGGKGHIRCPECEGQGTVGR